MSALRKAAHFVAGLLLLHATGTQAGGPAMLCNGAPLVNPGYPVVSFSFDLGNLGSRTKAQADAIVIAAMEVWRSPFGALAVDRGNDLPEDVTAANFTPYYANDADLSEPVIYDADGTITDLLFGVGARNSVIVSGHVGYLAEPLCRYTEARLLVNGAREVSDTALAIAIAHEIGHVIGLDHSQLDEEQGLAPGNVPLMYPVLLRDSLSLHEDDFAAAAALYRSYEDGLSELSGRLLLADGATPVLGANIWATEVTSGKVYGGVSDYLRRGTGSFKFRLAPGTYQLHAGAIHAAFVGASSVGPYAATASDLSFQPPLHVGGVPMAPVTLGNASPTTFTIVADCQASVDFRLDGTGAIEGNCNPASIAFPPNGAVLGGASQVFTWNDAGASSYWLQMGSRPGGSDIGYFPIAGTAGLSTEVAGLPTDGRAIYVRLWSMLQGAQRARDYVFTAFMPGVIVPATMISPPGGTPLTSSSQAFTWTDAGATSYRLDIGTAPGASDIGFYPAGGTTGTTTTVAGLPNDGRLLFVRLYSTFGGSEHFRDYAYTAFDSQGGPTAAIYDPAPGSTFTGTSATFRWTDAGSPQYGLIIGSAPGGSDIGWQNSYVPDPERLSAAISRIPTDGRTIYVRLYSYVNGVVRSRDYTYKALLDPAVVPAEITSPFDGSTLSGSVQTFTWNDTGASRYTIAMGSRQGESDLGSNSVTGTTFAFSAVPTDGRALYVSLVSTFGGQGYSRTYSYRAARLTEPVPATLRLTHSGNQFIWTTERFEWDKAWASGYELQFGSSPGAVDLGVYAIGDTPSVPMNGKISLEVTSLPDDGRAVYVRLVSIFDGVPFWRDYTYTAYAGGPIPVGITSPAPGSTLASDLQDFGFVTGNFFVLTVGSSPGASDFASVSGVNFRNGATVTNLPVDGRTLYVRLYSSHYGAPYVWRDYTYTAFTAPPLAANITSPPNGSELTPASQIFTWSGTGTVFALTVGSSVGAWDYGVQYSQTNSATVPGLPRDGRKLFVRLYTQVANGAVYTRDYEYTAFREVGLPIGSMSSPSNGSVFTSPRQVFSWTGSAAVYVLTAGSTAGAWDLGVAVTTANTATINGLPGDGRVVYVRLYSLLDGVWYQWDWSYRAFTGTLVPAAIVTPSNGTWLRGASQAFAWTDAMATLYLVWVGNAPGTNDLGTFPPEGTTATSTTITGLPMDGRTFFVRVWSFFGSTVLATDYAYRSIP